MQKKMSTTYYDLSLIVQKSIDPGYFLNKIKNNGYSIFALDIEYNDPKPNVNANKAGTNVPNFPFSLQKLKQQTPNLTLLKRITLLIENTISLHPLGQQQAPYECDILAVKPLNQKMFHSLCIEYDSYDIITFDIGNKLPFMLKRNPVYEAIRKGKYFQICYQSLFDENKRVIAMTNMINIIKATNGKNLIVSSHVSEGSFHRTPYDVAAMLISLGLNKEKALATMKQNCQQVVRSGQHRLYLKGAIKQIEGTIGLKLNKRIKKHRQNIRKLRDQQKKQRKAQKMQQQKK